MRFSSFVLTDRKHSKLRYSIIHYNVALIEKIFAVEQIFFQQSAVILPMNDTMERERERSPTNTSTDDSWYMSHGTYSQLVCDAGLENQSSVKLFVGSLPYDVNEEDLLSIFNKFGEIIEFAILRDRHGRSRGCAALRYASNEAAELCISTLHNRFCCGNVPSPLQVRYFEKREMSPTTCFIEGFPCCFSPHVLWTSLSSTYGPVSNVFMDVVNPFAAYVSFFKKSSAYALSSDARNGSLNVAGVVCAYARVLIMKPHAPVINPYGCYPAQFGYPVPMNGDAPSPVVETAPVETDSSDPPMKLFVGCLPYSKTAQDIADLFSPYGTLIEVAILTDYAGKSRGAAFVTFSKTSDAKKAVEELKDFSFPKSTRCINISFAYKQNVWNNRTVTENGTTASCTSSNVGEPESPIQDTVNDPTLVSA
jgi:RNA recognition motif-containing protein